MSIPSLSLSGSLSGLKKLFNPGVNDREHSEGSSQDALQTPLLSEPSDTFEQRLKRSGPLISEAQSQDNLNQRLRLAVQSGNKDAVAALISEGADVNASDPEHSQGQTPVLKALDNLDKDIIPLLMNAPGFDPNQTDHIGFTPLHWVSTYDGRAQYVETLIEKGADPNRPSNAGHSPLMQAAERGVSTSVRALLQSGKVDIYQENRDKQSVFEIALNKTRYTPEIQSLIVEYGIQHPPKGGYTAKMQKQISNYYNQTANTRTLPKAKNKLNVFSE